MTGGFADENEFIIQKNETCYENIIDFGCCFSSAVNCIKSFSIFVAKDAVTRAIDGEFAGIAAQNGVMIQSIFDAAANSAENLTNYIERLYVKAENWTAEQRSEKKRSQVYDAEIQSGCYDVEDYILNSIWLVVSSNPDICGMGVFFEQATFDPAINDYTIYINEEGAKALSPTSYGQPYSSYSQEEWYSVVKKQQSTYYTDPYAYEGITMISTAYPIMYNGIFQGAVMVDINVSNFSKIKTTDDKYPTMYVDILTHNNIIIFDSESLDFVGDDMGELLPASDTANIEAAQKLGKAFNIATKKNTGEYVSVTTTHLMPKEKFGGHLAF